MTDFREYQAAFQDHQNDLMHYGVKGMKWKHHKRLPIKNPNVDKNSPGVQDFNNAYEYALTDYMNKKFREEGHYSFSDKPSTDYIKSRMNNYRNARQIGMNLPEYSKGEVQKIIENSNGDPTRIIPTTYKGLSDGIKAWDRKTRRESIEELKKRLKKKSSK